LASLTIGIGQSMPLQSSVRSTAAACAIVILRPYDLSTSIVLDEGNWSRLARGTLGGTTEGWL
jgi:hypothetical protein